MNEGKVPDLSSADVRFTTKDGRVLAFVQGRPDWPLRIHALGSGSPQAPGRAVSVSLIGSEKTVPFRQTPSALTVTLPEDLAPFAVIGFASEVRFA